MEINNMITNKKGFTILEFLIYLVVVSSSAVIIGGTFLSVNESNARIQARTEVNTNIRFVLERIKQDIRSASNIVTPRLGVSSSSLVVTTLAGDVTYDVSSGQLRRTLSGNTAEPITSDNVFITALQFDRTENRNISLLKAIDSVKTSITVIYNTNKADLRYSQSAEISASLVKAIDPPAKAGGLPCSTCYAQGSYGGGGGGLPCLSRLEGSDNMDTDKKYISNILFASTSTDPCDDGGKPGDNITTPISTPA